MLRNPFTLFNSDDPWRPNPIVDEGLFHLADVSLKFDTRTDPEDPWSGWFLSTDLEYGRGTSTTFLPVGLRSRPSFGDITYTRGFFDFRRYNRLGPTGQLNMRLVLGGWIDGDPLPLQRRLSVDGPGTLPGYDFRSARAGPDVGACNVGATALGAAGALRSHRPRTGRVRGAICDSTSRVSGRIGRTTTGARAAMSHGSCLPMRAADGSSIDSTTR